MKQCIKCKKICLSSEFWKNKRNPDGLQNTCIHCQKSRWFDQVSMDPDKRAWFREQEKKKAEANVKAYLIRLAKRRAKDKGILCTITEKDFELPELCPIRLCKLEKHRGNPKYNSFSLDRIDPNQGYVPGNVRVISWSANQMKSTWTKEEIERLYLYVNQ